MTDSPVALILEDDVDFRASFAALVEREGFETRVAGSLKEARALFETGCRIDVMLTDLALPDGEGLDFLVERAANGTETVVVTGHATVDSAVKAIQAGALDFLTKPIDRPRLKTILTHVRRSRALKREVVGLRGELRQLGHFSAMLGRSKAMQTVYDMITRVAPTNASVLITGESGTGKELAAQTIHRLSARCDALLLPLNCGAVSATLIESELFGHERGSFTGAEKLRKGYFERANRGTLFLDEITEMPQDLQVKLLRVLETATVTRVGGTDVIPVDVRVIAATNRNPEEAVSQGKLRQDLFYRLQVFPIHLPPLRERDGDVTLLAQHFLDELNASAKTEKHFSKAAMQQILANPWTGNVRELKNAVQRAFILADEEIQGESLPRVGAVRSDSSDPLLFVKVGSSIADVEQRLIVATLDQLSGDKARAAEVLGISLKTLYNRLNAYAASPVQAARETDTDL